MARINTTVPDNMKGWLEDQPHLNASGLLQKAIDEEMAKSMQEIDTEELTSERSEWRVVEQTPAEPIAEWSAGETFFRLKGYDTDSDVKATLCCSECGERVELIENGLAIEGAICGCQETPERWEIRPLDSEQ